MKSEDAYREVKARIIGGLYSPGSLLQEKEICAELNISRTPYREALFQLHTEKLVEMKPNKGAVVKPIDLNSIKDIFEIRSILESVAARLAFMRINERQLNALKEITQKIEKLADTDDIELFRKLDAEFHEILLDAQGNKILKELLFGLRDQCMRLYNNIEERESVKDVGLRSIRGISQIYDAFVAKDAAKVEQLINDHFAIYLQTIAAHIQRGLGQDLRQIMQNQHQNQ
jgi:DNA-binding GntR family transcriptional regulator